MGSTAWCRYLMLQTNTVVEGGDEEEPGKEVTVVDGLALQAQVVY